MCLRFILSIFLLVAIPAQAENFASVTVAGKDLNEALVVAVRVAMQTQLTKEKQPSKSWVESEFIPHAAQLVNSYKIASESAGAVSIHAEVDMDAIRSVLALQPKSMGITEKEPKVLLLYRLPGIEQGSDMGAAKSLDAGIKEYFQRRKFTAIFPGASDSEDQFVTPESILLPDLIRAEAQKQNAVLVFSLMAIAGKQENENSHREEEKWFLTAQVLEVSKLRVLSKLKATIPAPIQVKKEEWPKVLEERGLDLVHELLLKAGEKYASASDGAAKGIIPLRIISPPSFKAANALRLALETGKEIKSIQEAKVSRGLYEYAVKTSLSPAALAEKVRSLSLPGFAIILEQNNPDTIQVRMEVRPEEPAPEGEKKP